MKVLIPLLITTILFSCSQKSNSALSEEQKKKIQNEIQPVIAQIHEAAIPIETPLLIQSSLPALPLSLLSNIGLKIISEFHLIIFRY